MHRYLVPAAAYVSSGGSGNTPVSPTPTVTGSGQVGSTLYSVLSGNGYSYQWLRGSTPISGATSSSYTIQASDAGYSIYLQVLQNLGTASGASIPLPLPQYTLLPIISGTPVPATVLTATNGTWMYSPSTYTKQWTKDGVPISGATGSSYTVQFTDIGHAIGFTVIANNASGASTPVSAAAVTIVASYFDWDWTPAYPDRSGVTTFTTYEVGPGQTYTDLSTVPWQELVGGDIVNIHYRAQPYNNLVYLGCRGTANKWITIKGVPGPNGERPVVTGASATCSGTLTQPAFEGYGVFVLGRPITGTHPQADGYKPGYIHITGLAITGNKSPNTFVLASGSALGTAGSNRSWPEFSACIYCNPVEYLAVTDCELYDSGLGIFVNSRPSNSGLDLNGNQSRNIYIAGNYFHGNGAPGNYGIHHSYTEAIGTIYEYNYFGNLAPSASGDCVKDRSAGHIFRYNYITGGYGYQLALRDPESDVNNEKIRVDQLGQLLIGNSFIYGNFFYLATGGGNAGTMIGFGDGYNNGGGQYIRHGNINFYQNVVVSKYDKADYARDGVVLFEPINQHAPVGQTDYPCTDPAVVRNNMFYCDSATNGATPAPMCLFRRAGKADFQSNLINNFSNIITNWGGYTSDIWAGTPYDGTGLRGLTAQTYTPGFTNYAGGDFSLQPSSPFFSLSGEVPSEAVLRGLWCDDLYVTTPPTTLQGSTIRSTEKPVASNTPSISGTPSVGQTLTVVPGTWSSTLLSTITKTYKWVRNGTPIGGATGTTYTLVPADGGQVVTVIEYATNTAGTNSRVATSVNVAVHPSAPAVSTAPTITGDGGATNAGLLFTVNPGSWTNTPTSYQYQWYANGAIIPGQTSNTLQTLGSWATQAITCKVWGTNSYGQSLPSTSGSVTLGTAVAMEPDGTGLFTFDAPDGASLTDINPAWSGSGISAYAVYSNALKVKTGMAASASKVSYIAGPTTSTNQRITLVRQGNADTNGLYVYMCDNGTTSYMLNIANNAIVLLKNGSYFNSCYYNTIPQANINYAQDTTFVLEIVNGTVTAKINGVTAFTQVDGTPITTGYFGIYPSVDTVALASLRIERT